MVRLQLCQQLVCSRSGDEPADCILLNNRPKEYVDRYIEKNYVVRDPVVTELRKTLHPFTWSDVRTRRALSKSEKSIMDEARDFGARDGFIVPIVTLSGSVSLFSPCGLEPNLTSARGLRSRSSGCTASTHSNAP